jgi:hypothetical protein
VHRYTQALLLGHNEVYAVLQINKLPNLYHSVSACAAHKVVLVEIITAFRTGSNLLLRVELTWTYVFEVERTEFMLRVVTGLKFDRQLLHKIN